MGLARHYARRIVYSDMGVGVMNTYLIKYYESKFGGNNDPLELRVKAHTSTEAILIAKELEPKLKYLLTIREFPEVQDVRLF